MEQVTYQVNGNDLIVPVDDSIFLHILSCKKAYFKMHKTNLKQLNLPALSYLLLWVWCNARRDRGDEDKTFSIPNEFVVAGVVIQAMDECARVFDDAILVTAADAKAVMMKNMSQDVPEEVMQLIENLGGSCGLPNCSNPHCSKDKQTIH